MSLKPLKDSVLFTFVQAHRQGFFRQETSWGFQIAGTDHDAGKSRWGLVEHVGPDCRVVKPGDYILIEPLKWTTAVEHEGKKYWRTAEPHIELVSETRPTDIL